MFQLGIWMCSTIHTCPQSRSSDSNVNVRAITCIFIPSCWRFMQSFNDFWVAACKKLLYFLYSLREILDRVISFKFFFFFFCIYWHLPCLRWTHFISTVQRSVPNEMTDSAANYSTSHQQHNREEDKLLRRKSSFPKWFRKACFSRRKRVKGAKQER